MAGGVRVGVAFGSSVLAASPTWSWITAHPSLVASFSIDRGRQYELDQTDAGRATVTIHDRDGVLDPTNADSPYNGQIEPMLQATLDLWNPVTSEYVTIFRGFIEDYDYDIDPSQFVATLTLSLVDAFGYLGAVEMQPDLKGDGTPSFGDIDTTNSQPGDIYYLGAEDPQARIDQALTDAGWPPALSTIFSGNTLVYAAFYSPGESVLTVLQDAADAEFPGVGNLFVSKDGKVTFHGRWAKFDPSVPISSNPDLDWDWHHWKAGDGAAVHISGAGSHAQIRQFAYNWGRSKIINYACATPVLIKDSDRKSMVYKDETSIASYGYATWTKDNLLTAGKGDRTANDECKLFGYYYMANYREPQKRVTALGFRSLHPDDPRAPYNWDLLCNAEIGDQIDVTLTLPGDGYFNDEPYWIEGIHYEVNPATPDYADVTMTLDLSPKAYYPPTWWSMT